MVIEVSEDSSESEESPEKKMPNKHKGIQKADKDKKKKKVRRAYFSKLIPRGTN